MRDMRTFAADVPVAWCLLVCHAPAPCKTADQMDVLFRFGNPRNIVLDGVPITLRRRGRGSGKMLPNLRTGLRPAKTAEQTEV